MDEMGNKWTYIPVQPLSPRDKVSVGELLQVVQGLYAGLFVRVEEILGGGALRVRTVGLRSLIVDTTLPKTQFTRDSLPRRYLLGAQGFRELQRDLERQQTREVYQRRRRMLVRQHRKALRKQLKSVTGKAERKALTEASTQALSRVLKQLEMDLREEAPPEDGGPK